MQIPATGMQIRTGITIWNLATRQAFRALITLLFSLLAVVPTQATECQVCGSTSQGNFYTMSSRARPGTIVVCESCARSPKQCAVCQLPVARDFMTTDDGRILCAECKKSAVMDPTIARTLFLDVKRDMMRLLSGLGVLPDRNIDAQLVSQLEIARLMMGTPRAHSDGSYQGVTRTRKFGESNFDHKVYLCNGLPPARIAAVSAHEYTHAWIHENKDPERILDRDTEEAFCELAALQIMRQRGEVIESNLILSNAYTRGKIGVLAQVSDTYQFYRVAQWIKSGVDPALETATAERVNNLRGNPNPDSSRIWFQNWTTEVQARAPDRLTLKGLAGNAPRRFALINDATLQEGEERRVRVGTGQVTIRCEQIKRDSVVIRVEGSTDSQELYLSAPSVTRN